MLQGSMAMSLCSLEGALWLCVFLCLLPLFSSCKCKKKTSFSIVCFCFLIFSFPLPPLCPFAVSHFAPFPPPSSACPLLSDEPVPECRRYVQVRNITKGDCRLDNVEVSFCRGRCLSRTDVILEVWRRDICTHTHIHTQKILLSEHEATLTSVDFNMSYNR